MVTGKGSSCEACSYGWHGEPGQQSGDDGGDCEETADFGLDTDAPL